VVTGSPKFDALLESARTLDRAAVRARLGVAQGERLLLVASRFRGIRGTHQSIGSAFPALVRAVERLGVRCLVKPHPAEPADVYARVVKDEHSTRVSVLSTGADLVELLHASDALCTVESLSAVEALVLERPVLLLNMPTNLRRMAEQGVALGVAAGTDPEEALRQVLFDEATQGRLREARARYLSDLAHGVDGEATTRIVALLREAASPARA
jgi:CDP-glycerol glycerophosphotransferase (TagB/SpsB family)